MNSVGSLRGYITALCSLLAVIALVIISNDTFIAFDFPVWKNDWDILVACLYSNGFGWCNQLSKFPLAYLGNAYLASGDARMVWMVNLIAILFPAICLIVLRGWRTGTVVVLGYLLALLISPLPIFYLSSGALEVQAGVISGIYIACLARKIFRMPEMRPYFVNLVLIVTGLITPLYKDTTAVLIVLSCVLVLIASHLPGGARLLRLNSGVAIKSLLVGLSPLFFGLLLSCCYNLTKYGVAWPVAYMHEATETSPSLWTSTWFLFGSLLSPNGGVVVFWSLALTVAVASWRISRWVPNTGAIWLATVAALLSWLTFARWWAPFGWDSWGNRLMIPPMVALLVAMTLTVEPSTSGIRHSWRVRLAELHSRLGSILLCLPVLAWSGYYMLIPYVSERDKAISASLYSGQACEEMRRRLEQEGSSMGSSFWKTDTYYRCARERMMHVPAPTSFK